MSCSHTPRGHRNIDTSKKWKGSWRWTTLLSPRSWGNRSTERWWSLTESHIALRTLQFLNLLFCDLKNSLKNNNHWSCSCLFRVNKRDKKKLHTDCSVLHPSLWSTWLVFLVNRSITAECPKRSLRGRGGESALNFFKMSGHRWPYLLGNDYNGQGQFYYWIGLKKHQWAIRGILQAYLPFWPLLALPEGRSLHLA